MAYSTMIQTTKTMEVIKKQLSDSKIDSTCCFRVLQGEFVYWDVSVTLLRLSSVFIAETYHHWTQINVQKGNLFIISIILRGFQIKPGSYESHQVLLAFVPSMFCHRFY